MHEIGARGVISVTSNIVPGLFSKLMKERDADLNASLQPLIKWLFHEPNPIPVNTGASMRACVRACSTNRQASPRPGATPCAWPGLRPARSA